DQVTGLAPSTRRPYEVVLGGRELRPAVATGLRHGELQEPLGRPVVEPVDDPPRLHPIGDRVVREDLDVHPPIDDLADLLLRAVGQRDPGAVVEAPEHDDYHLPELV